MAAWTDGHHRRWHAVCGRGSYIVCAEEWFGAAGQNGNRAAASGGCESHIGKAAIHANDKHEQANANGGRTFCYRAEIEDLQIAGDWAFEWGYFSYKESANSKPGHGKFLRVIKRQPDGSRKFARLMGFPEPVDAAAPMSHSCE